MTHPAAGCYRKHHRGKSLISCLGSADQSFPRPDVWTEGGFEFTILTIKNGGKGEWQLVRPGLADPRARLVKHESN